MQGAQDMQRARELRAESEKAQAELNAVFKLISTASDAAVIAYSDPASKASAAVALTQKLFDALGGDPWLEEAEKLEAKAHKAGAVNAEKKFAASKTYMKQLNQQLSGLRARFPEYQAHMDNTRRTVEESYDKIAQGQKSGNNFKFDRLQQAIDVAHTDHRLRQEGDRSSLRHARGA